VVTEKEISWRAGVWVKVKSWGGGEMERRRDSRGSRNGESKLEGGLGRGVEGCSSLGGGWRVLWRFSFV